MIHVKDDWYIDVDEASYNLMQYAGKRPNKNGELIDSYKNITYHSTLERALKQYIRYRVKDSLQEDMELREAVQAVQVCLSEVASELKNCLCFDVTTSYGAKTSTVGP